LKIKDFDKNNKTSTISHSLTTKIQKISQDLKVDNHLKKY